MKKPLFDPEEDRNYTEEEKWRIARAAVDQHYDDNPNEGMGLAAWVAVAFVIAVIVIVSFLIWRFM